MLERKRKEFSFKDRKGRIFESMVVRRQVVTFNDDFVILFKVRVGIHDVSVWDRPVGGHVGRDDL